jgi:hypothetical protein
VLSAAVLSVHVIASHRDVVDALRQPGTLLNDGYSGMDYPWECSLVVSGTLYENVGFRARGGMWRYAMGKNMWKFRFADGHGLGSTELFADAARRIFPNNLNLIAGIQQGDSGMRGEHGMFDASSYKLFEQAGVPAPSTTWVHLRVVDAVDETGLDQYSGDFFGLYLAVEEPDRRFLARHGLPKGDLFKMAENSGFLKAKEARDSSYEAFDAFVAAMTKPQTEEWWRENVDLEQYYSYRAVVECVHDYDLDQGKNYYYYMDPSSKKWQARIL